MTGISFIEIEPEGRLCWRCGRGTINEQDKFYSVFVGDNPLGIVVCELCKGGFSVRMLEGAEKSYATHLKFYVRRSLLELRERLPSNIYEELVRALESYEVGHYSPSFRCIGLVAEWLTDELFIDKFGKSNEETSSRWESKLGKLLEASRKTKSTPEEAIVYQLFF